MVALTVLRLRLPTVVGLDDTVVRSRFVGKGRSDSTPPSGRARRRRPGRPGLRELDMNEMRERSL
jgi:hypothetical protein